MSTLPLLDYALSSGEKGNSRRQTKGRLTQFAESLVRSVLDEVHQVLLFEKSVKQTNGEDDDFQFNRDVAVLVRYSYEECMKQAEQVLHRVDRLELRGHKIKGAEKLRDEHGRLSAMLSVSLEEIKLAQSQANGGKVRSVAELRHELQASLQLGHSSRMI